MLDPETIPADFPVQPKHPDLIPAGAMTCGTCGLTWDNHAVTSMTPVPSGRCPFEYFHDEEDEVWYEIVRFQFKEPSEVIKSGLTLEEAQEHCNRDDTHGDGWFDGYRAE